MLMIISLQPCLLLPLSVDAVNSRCYRNEKNQKGDQADIDDA